MAQQTEDDEMETENNGQQIVQLANWMTVESHSHIVEYTVFVRVFIFMNMDCQVGERKCVCVSTWIRAIIDEN